MNQTSDGSMGMDEGSQVPPSPPTSGDASHGSYRFVDGSPSLPRRVKREPAPAAVQLRLSKKAQQQLQELEKADSGAAPDEADGTGEEE